jgi:hypothetical protein
VVNAKLKTQITNPVLLLSESCLWLMRCWQGKFTTPTPSMNPVNGVCFVASTHILSLYVTLNSILKQANL